MTVSTFTRTLALIALLSLPILTSACNTMEGVGADVKAGGEKLEDTAQDAKN